MGFRLLVGLVCLFCIWAGGGSFIDNFKDQKPQTFTLAEVEKNGVGNSMYVVITDAIPLPVASVMTIGENEKPIFVTFPISSIGDGRSRVFISRTGIGGADSSCTADNFYCITQDRQTFRGLVSSAAKPVSQDMREHFAEEGISVPDNAILIHENHEPNSPWSNLMLFIAGVLGLILIVVQWQWSRLRSV